MIDLTKPIRSKFSKVPVTLDQTQTFTVRFPDGTELKSYTLDGLSLGYENIPEPKKPREFYLHIFDSGRVDVIQPPRTPCERCVRVREVLE